MFSTTKLTNTDDVKTPTVQGGLLNIGQDGLIKDENSPHKYWESEYLERVKDDILHNKSEEKMDEVYFKDYVEAYSKIVACNTVKDGISSSSQEGEVLTHVTKAGDAYMVDVGGKDTTLRKASARGIVVLLPKMFKLVEENKMKKGDVLSVARIAGIMAAKRTPDLIPLCHPIPITSVEVTISLREDDYSAIIEATVMTRGVTGVEMEAITAVSVAALTVYDMCKAISHEIIIKDIRLTHKSGGKRYYSEGLSSS